MTPHSLFPCSLQLDYRTLNAPHLMTVPLREWSPISGGHPAGTNLDWTDSQVDTAGFVDDFVDLLLPFYDVNTHFTSYTINTYVDSVAPARPQVIAGLTGKVGSGDATIPAAQATFNFKTSCFFPFKIVMLDAKVSATFGPVESLVSPLNDDEIALRNFVLLDTSPFTGRDECQPVVLRRITYTLNEKLRKSYRLD